MLATAKCGYVSAFPTNTPMSEFYSYAESYLIKKFYLCYNNVRPFYEMVLKF